ncbi:MAG TPA: ankyrin repeat domain-containing protein [Planctomycetota bacterium]|nr:ankyrin repeat domain-containing protein [Planctomycetota bacterium]
MMGLLLVVAALQAPLADAAERADFARMRALLDGGADATAAQVDGMTALHWAAHHDDADAVRRLLAAGAKAGAASRYGVTPLSLACLNGNEAVVRLLLEAGADPDAALPGGETPLMTAARTGRPGPVGLLLARGAKVDAADPRGQTALMWAAAEGHEAVVRLLLKAGADRGRRLASGFTALLFAARNGKREVVRALLEAGADPNEAIRTKQGGRGMARSGTSALILAVENAHYELALELVKAGADPNDLRSGYAPLHTLTWVRKPHRGDGEDGQPPPAGSGRVDSLAFARELVKLGATVDLPLPKGASGKGKLTEEGATPLLFAARRADLPYMKLLAELGADPLRPNKDGCTPLMAAAGVGTLFPTEEAGTEDEALDCVRWLIAAGGDVNAADRNGETAMHGAAYKSLPRMVRLLTESGAKVEVWNRKNRHGWTPVLIAEGFRPGNFKPAPDTLAALHQAMTAAGVAPPPPTPRPDPAKDKKGYDED